MSIKKIKGGIKMSEVLITAGICAMCFLSGLIIGVCYAKKIKREVWEKLEVVDKKIDEIQKKVR